MRRGVTFYKQTYILATLYLLPHKTRTCPKNFILVESRCFINQRKLEIGAENVPHETISRCLGRKKILANILHAVAQVTSIFLFPKINEFQN